MPSAFRNALPAAILFVLISSLLFLAMPDTASSQTNTATPTQPRMTTRTPDATPTRPRSMLATPTLSIPEPLLTLTAFNAMILGTFESRPTATPGISDIVLNGKPHYIRFTATWCQPCRQMRPFVQAMQEKYRDRVNFWDVDVDNRASRNLMRRYNVQFIPYTVLLDSRGRTFLILEGFQTRQELDQAIQALLANE
ncbi:MAG: thioredoxin domain-containing protein [Anaerolineae bacterium]|nr:thioredoxin domain-containing protein [Anaerolineae bacterium]MDW8299601.1 thioredoxin domain-containing protein [Anaerolineae bacterium]